MTTNKEAQRRPRLTNEQFYLLRKECKDMAEFAQKAGYTIGAAQTRAHDVKKWAEEHKLPWPKFGRATRKDAPPSDALLSVLAAEEGLTLEAFKAKVAGNPAPLAESEAPATKVQTQVAKLSEPMETACHELEEASHRLSEAAHLILDAAGKKVPVEDEELVGAM